MFKISGRHKSVPRELKRALKSVFTSNTKIVMNDICSCRHAYSPGTLKFTEINQLTAKLRGYYGSGIVNFFVKFASEEDKFKALESKNNIQL